MTMVRVDRMLTKCPLLNFIPGCLPSFLEGLNICFLMMPRCEKRQCLVVQNSLNEVIKWSWKMIFCLLLSTTENSEGVHQRKDYN